MSLNSSNNPGDPAWLNWNVRICLISMCNPLSIQVLCTLIAHWHSKGPIQSISSFPYPSCSHPHHLTPPGAYPLHNPTLYLNMQINIKFRKCARVLFWTRVTLIEIYSECCYVVYYNNTLGLLSNYAYLRGRTGRLGWRRNEELSWTCHFGINKATHVIELRSTWTGDVVEGEPTGHPRCGCVLPEECIIILQVKILHR